MSVPAEPDEWRGWQRTLAENQLAPEQLKVLEQMVADGESDSVETAAKMLDWQDSVINRAEHMYGF